MAAGMIRTASHGPMPVVVLAALVFATACGGSPRSAATPSPPHGFTVRTDPRFGFQIALAPGWKEAGRNPEGSVAYAGPHGLAMLVHFEQATSSQVRTAAIPALSELTEGAGLAGERRSSARLAGQPAERVEGRLTAAGAVQALAAYLMVEGGRICVVALEGAPAAVDRATPTWEKMVATFRLVGARPSPPARATIGRPAPTFPALDQARGPVVINFFATWCSDCRTDMPTIAGETRSHPRRFTLIAVDCCGDRASAVPGFLRQMDVAGRFRDIAYDRDNRIITTYAVLGPPTTVFLDRNHVLRWIIVGTVSASSFEQGLREAGAA